MTSVICSRENIDPKSDARSNLICLGSPVSLPLNCSSPIDFGDLSLGSTATINVNCTALIGITKLNGLVTADPAFQALNSSLPQGPLAAGDKFSFPLTWNLTQANIEDAQGASFGSVAPGVKSSSVVIFTTNAVPQFSNSLPVSVQGNEVSNLPFLAVSPAEVDMGGIVIGGPGAATGLDSSFIISNVGLQPLTITGYGYTDDIEPPVQYTNVTFGENSQIGELFTSSDLPAVGTIVSPGSSLTIPIKFKATEVGNYQNIFQIWSDGGNKNVLFTGSATTAPIAELTVETSEHGWDPSGIMDFGDVLAGTTQTRRIRICNTGGSALLITKSKPPIQTELQAENPTSDLHEGQLIAVNDCAYGPIDISSTPETPNVPDHVVSDTWTLNTDDLDFGVHEVKVSANIVSRKLGPTNPDGSPIFQYLGCYYDGQGRNLQKLFNLGAANDNDACQKQCYANNYRFAGTEYHTECWCGNTPPSSAKYTPVSAKKCTFGCANDTTQACGGDGTYMSIYYNATSYKPDCSAIPCSSSSLISSSTQTSSFSSSLSSSSSVSVSLTSSISSSSTGIPSSSISGTLTASSSSVSSGSSGSTSVSTSLVAASSTTSSVLPPPTPTGPVINPGNANYSYVACYADGATKAISSTTFLKVDTMTVAICLAFCKSKGSTYAGLEYRYVNAILHNLDVMTNVDNPVVSVIAEMHWQLMRSRVPPVAR